MNYNGWQMVIRETLPLLNGRAFDLHRDCINYLYSILSEGDINTSNNNHVEIVIYLADK